MTNNKIKAKHSVGLLLEANKMPLNILTNLDLTLMSSRFGSSLSTSCHIDNIAGQEHSSNSSVNGGKVFIDPVGSCSGERDLRIQQ